MYHLLYYIILHCIILYYITLQYITLHYINVFIKYKCSLKISKRSYRTTVWGFKICFFKAQSIRLVCLRYRVLLQRL